MYYVYLSWDDNMSEYINASGPCCVSRGKLRVLTITALKSYRRISFLKNITYFIVVNNYTYMYVICDTHSVRV